MRTIEITLWPLEQPTAAASAARAGIHASLPADPISSVAPRPFCALYPLWSTALSPCADSESRSSHRVHPTREKRTRGNRANRGISITGPGLAEKSTG